MVETKPVINTDITLAQIIMAQYPQARVGRDFVVALQPDGSQLITVWNTTKLGPIPAYDALWANKLGLTIERAKNLLVNGLQQWLDNTAQERGYDNIFSATTYFDDPNPAFAKEGTAYKHWRSAVWSKCYEIFAMMMPGIMAGTTPIPTLDELKAQLPTFVSFLEN